MNAQRKISRPSLWTCILAALLITASANAQNVSVTDYRVPVSRADNLRINALSFNFTSEGNDIVHEQGEVGLVYKRFYSSQSFAYFIDVLNSASYIRVPDLERAGAYDRDGVYEITLDMQLQKYFRETNEFFYSISPEILMRRGFARPQVDIIFGLGYGRFINATPLRKAVRIEEALFKEGVISDHLPKDTMIELGQLIEKEDEYRDHYGDRPYQNYWYEDISNEINKTGLVTGGGNLGPIAILRMRDVLTQEQISDRFVGWDISAGIQHQLRTREKNIERPPPAMAVSMRYSRPVSWRMQINTDFKFDTPTPFNNDFGKAYSVRQNIDFIYEITNKIAFVTSNTFQVSKENQQDAKFRYVSTSNFTFFIENKISLAAIEQVFKEKGSSFRQSFLLGLSYRIF